MLQDVLALEIGNRLSTGFAGKMLRDLGATVVRVELQERPDLAQAEQDFATFLHGGKHSVRASSVGAVSMELPGLAARADVVVCDDEDPTQLAAIQVLRADRPDLVVVTISDYGLNGAGPSAPASELTLEAESGLVALHRTGDRPPVYAGVDLGEYAAGLNAAVGVVAGLLAVEAGGRAIDADVSRLESMLALLQLPWVFAQHPHHAPYTVPQAAVPGLERASDGWACVVCVTPQQWTDFKSMAQVPELDDPRFEHLVDRQDLHAVITPLVRRFTERHTVAELVEMGSTARVPIVPVATSTTVTQLPPYAARGTFVTHPDGFIQPRPAFRPENDAWRPGELAAPGRDQDRDWGARPLRPRREGADPARPLAGVRVAEFGGFQAGPLVGRDLSSLGADVVKVESVNRPDLLRFGGPDGDFPDPWERGASFTASNWGKRSLTADMKDPDGLDIIRRLVATSDVVLENFSPRVMENAGLDADGVRALNPDAIIMRLPAWGLEGPWKDLPGFTYSADAASGLSDLTGYPDGDPLLTGTTFDPIAAATSTFVTLAAVRQRFLTGSGTAVEVSLCDVAPQTTAAAVIESSRTGLRVDRRGNDAAGVAPHGLYQAADGDWVALSISSDQAWKSLAEIVGEPDWATDPRRAAAADRVADRSRIDADLRTFVAGVPGSELVARLRGAGIPAATMQTGMDADRHPALLARGRCIAVQHAVNGVVTHVAPPTRLSSQPDGLAIPRPAPLFGEHNVEILTELGFSHDHIDQLHRDGKIGDSPFGLPVGARPAAGVE